MSQAPSDEGGRGGPGLTAGVRPPPTVALLGWSLIKLDAAAGAIEVAYVGKPEFCNPAGNVQGGFLAAMIDDAMGPVVLAHSGGARFCSTIDLHTHYMRPVKPGRITVRASVTKMGRSVAFIEAQLFDAEDRLCARATSSAQLVDLPQRG